MVTAVTVLVRAPATIVQTVIPFVERTDVRATVGINDFFGRDIAGTVKDLQHRPGYLPLGRHAVIETRIKVVKKRLLLELRQNRNGPGCGPELRRSIAEAIAGRRWAAVADGAEWEFLLGIVIVDHRE